MKATFVQLPELFVRLSVLANELIAADAPPRIRDLRAQDQKTDREKHQAALLARAIQGVLGIDPSQMFVGFPEDEYCAYDAILLWKDRGHVTQLNVQLKELPPASLAHQISIEEIIAKAIAKLGRAPDVLLAIFANRGGGAQRVEVPDHKLGGVCAFGVDGLTPRTVFVVGFIGAKSIKGSVPLRIPGPSIPS